MAELTAKVRLEVKDALSALDKLERRIQSINSTINGQSTKANSIDRQVKKIVSSVTQVDNANKRAATSASQMASGYKNANKQASILTKNLRTLVSTYLGVMGAKAVLGASDTLTSGQNRLNAINANGGEYTPEVYAKTAQQLDKVYAAAQRARTGYSDMLRSVSKVMTLAGDAFGNNMDNAIRFQEIMAKSYALAGASAAEQASSMYQLTQALGSGILQGDELRSVREGAPLAYKEIEKFAQKVLETDKSLKELASDGQITSDIVVAAIMNAGDAIDQQFQNTTTTFAQAGDMIKNAATKAFQPVLEQLNSMLNSESMAVFLNNVINMLYLLADAASWLIDVFAAFFNFMFENWSWMQWVVYAFVAAGLLYIGILAGQWIKAHILMAAATWKAWLPWVAGIAVLALVLTYIAHVANTAASGAQFIQEVCLTLAAVLIATAAVVGLIIGNVALGIVAAILALVLLLVVAISRYGEQIGQVIAAVASVVWNIFVTLVATIIQGAVLPLVYAWQQFANFFGNVFTDPIAAIIHMFEGLANAVLGILKTIASGIDAIFGSNLASTVSGWMSKVSGKADELAGKYGNGKYETKSEAVSALNDLMSGAVDKFTWDTSLAIKQGGEVGSSVQSAINNFGSGIQSKFQNISTNGLNLGSDYGTFTGTNGLNYATNPNLNLGYTSPSQLSDNLGGLADDKAAKKAGKNPAAKTAKNTGKTAKNTGKMADSMDMTQEDLEYLRKIADMEWKKEFTTAQITVDMSNYNTINGTEDIDGIVTKLADKLYEELNVVANGSYV